PPARAGERLVIGEKILAPQGAHALLLSRGETGVGGSGSEERLQRAMPGDAVGALLLFADPVQDRLAGDLDLLRIEARLAEQFADQIDEERKVLRETARVQGNRVATRRELDGDPARLEQRGE